MVKFKRLVLTVLDSPRRDFEWRFFLAVRLARFGISSAIGSKPAIKAIHRRSRYAILFGRLGSAASRSQQDRLWVDSFSELGTQWLFFHDEGGIYPQWIYEQNVKRGYPEHYFDQPFLSKIFFWGKRQERYFIGHKNHEKFQVVGSPRLDLMRGSYDHVDSDHVDRLRNQYGRYTLICSRFAAANKVEDEPHPLNKRFRDILAESGVTDEPQSPEVIRQQFQRWNRTAHEFPEFICAVAELLIRNSDRAFVIRPHPTEKAWIYHEAFGSFKNAHIDRSADVRPLIRGADCVIHSECTTGLEAAVNGKPTINFRPWAGDDGLSIEGVSEVGRTCRNVDEIIALHSQINSSSQPEIWADWSAVSDIVINADPCETEATERIVKAILDVCNDMERPTELSAVAGSGPRAIARRVLANGRRLMKSVAEKRLSGADRTGVGDTKAYAYEPEVVADLWQSFGGHGALSFDDDVVWVLAE